MDKDNQKQMTESLESPFDKLAPEVTGHILSLLNHHIPSLMAASSVCHLWRDLVDWRQVEQLHLDFESMHINEVSMEYHKWPLALESLLPKVKLTSLRVTLPYELPDKQDIKGGTYAPSLFWPLSLLDCGVVVHSLISNHQASFSSVTVVNIQGCPRNPEFEFMSHLLELCPSLSVLKLTLTVDQFPWSSLQWALRGKSITSLSVTQCHIGSVNSSQHMAQLCQVLAPGTLKTLTLVTNVYQDSGHGPDSTFPLYGTMPTFHSFPSFNEHVLCFDQFLATFQTSIQSVAALEHLHFGARQLVLSQHFVDFMVQLIHNKVLPKLRTIKFNIPDCDLTNWSMIYAIVDMLATPPFNQPLDVALTSSFCTLVKNFSILTQHRREDPIYVTKEGYNHHLQAENRLLTMKFVYKRLSRTNAMISCPCDVCCSEYHWMKGKVLKQLRAPKQDRQEWISDAYIFSCHFDRLRADLMDEFPTLEFYPFHAVYKGESVRIKVEGKEIYSKMFAHNDARLSGLLCAGCVFMSE